MCLKLFAQDKRSWVPLYDLPRTLFFGAQPVHKINIFEIITALHTAYKLGWVNRSQSEAVLVVVQKIGTILFKLKRCCVQICVEVLFSYSFTSWQFANVKFVASCRISALLDWFDCMKKICKNKLLSFLDWLYLFQRWRRVESFKKSFFFDWLTEEEKNILEMVVMRSDQTLRGLLIFLLITLFVKVPE